MTRDYVHEGMLSFGGDDAQRSEVHERALRHAVVWDMTQRKILSVCLDMPCCGNLMSTSTRIGAWILQISWFDFNSPL